MRIAPLLAAFAAAGAVGSAAGQPPDKAKKADGDYRRQVEDIGKLYVRSATGEMVPLGTLINVENVLGPVLRIPATLALTKNVSKPLACRMVKPAVFSLAIIPDKASPSRVSISYCT